MKRLIKALMPLVDVLMVPAVYPAALLLKIIRQAGVQRMPLCRRALMQVGVFPIRNHYYEPFFDGKRLSSLSADRELAGIDWNIPEQLALLERFNFNRELDGIPRSKPAEVAFYMDNENFESGDAEYFYNLIRTKKPSRIFEIGSGNSTLMAIKAIAKNQEDDPTYLCKHLCVEPYEMPWLEKTGVIVIRRRVEEIGTAFFSELGPNDILFIDSSHVIRPQGDVLFEYLELLPSLRVGVIVHVHDIFSPKDYLTEWLVDEVKFWNEQYLLEAFLTCNRDWKILGALNYLHHNHYPALSAKCPFLTERREPGSFYMQKMI